MSKNQENGMKKTNYVRKSYVKFFYDGQIFEVESFSGIWSKPREIKSRDISRIKVPNTHVKCCFFDILSTVMNVDGKKVKFKSGRVNVKFLNSDGSPWR